MGFANGRFATVWEVSSIGETMTKMRVSTSRKDRQTGAWETDFSGFVAVVGRASASKALSLAKENLESGHVKIKITDCEVTQKYDKSSGKTYTNFTIWAFETQDEMDNQQKAAPTERADEGGPVFDGVIDEDDDLPF